MAKESKYEATLIRGTSHTLFGVGKFVKGKTVIVDETVKAKLETANETVTLTDGKGNAAKKQLPRFKFTKVGAKKKPEPEEEEEDTDEALEGDITESGDDAEDGAGDEEEETADADEDTGPILDEDDDEEEAAPAKKTAAKKAAPAPKKKARSR